MLQSESNTCNDLMPPAMLRLNAYRKARAGERSAFSRRLEFILEALENIATVEMNLRFTVAAEGEPTIEEALGFWEEVLGAIQASQTTLSGSEGERRFDRDVRRWLPGRVEEYRNAKRDALDRLDHHHAFIVDVLMGESEESLIPDVAPGKPGPSHAFEF